MKIVTTILTIIFFIPNTFACLMNTAQIKGELWGSGADEEGRCVVMIVVKSIQQPARCAITSLKVSKDEDYKEFLYQGNDNKCPEDGDTVKGQVQSYGDGLVFVGSIY